MRFTLRSMSIGIAALAAVFFVLGELRRSIFEAQHDRALRQSYSRVRALETRRAALRDDYHRHAREFERAETEHLRAAEMRAGAFSDKVSAASSLSPDPRATPPTYDTLAEDSNWASWHRLMAARAFALAQKYRHAADDPDGAVSPDPEPPLPPDSRGKW